MKTKHILFILGIMLLFAACAPYVDVNSCLVGKTYGFWGGLWHGIIAPIDLIAMIFSDKYVVYAANNTGTWYAFGFVLGSGGWGFLGGKGAHKKCK